MKERPGFMIYFDRLSFLDRLDDAQCGQLLRAMVDYSKDGVVPILDDVPLEVAWDVVRPMLDKDVDRYREVCEKNRENAIKRWQFQKERQT